MSIHIKNSIDTTELESPEIEVTDTTLLPAKVILFNDEWHTFDEVISQLIKATNCTPARAEALAFEVDRTGKAVVFEGEMNECLKVSNILEEIELNTQIEY